MTDQDETSAEPVIDILARFKDRTLLDAVDHSARSGANAPLAAAVAKLHNAGQIDALEIGAWPALEGLKAYKRHFVERFIGLILPEIETPTTAMLAFVEALTAAEPKGYHAFFDGLQTWMQRRPAQAQEIVDLALQGAAPAASLLSVALQALANPSGARAIIAAHDDDRRFRAIHSLGWIVHSNAAEVDATVTALAALLTDADDDLRARVLECLANLSKTSKLELPPNGAALVGDLLATPGDATRHRAARALLEAATLGDAAVAALLAGLLDVNPDNAGTIESLDYALADMLSGARATEALGFLAHLIPASSGRLRLSTFEMTVSQLLTGPHALLADTTVDWLLTGQSSLGAGLSKALGRVGGEPVILRPDLTTRGFSDRRLVSLARKAIGFFHLAPVTAASLVVAALRVAPKGAAAEIETLLFQTLLVHYGGALESYLSRLPKTDAAYRPVRRALKRKAAYLKELQAPGRIAELRPSEQHRQAEHERHSDEMRRSFEQARKGSQVLSLFPTSTMLYGRQSMSFMVDPNGQRQSTSVMLQSHGATFEVPRGLKLDPMGLEEMTVVFRSEKVAP